jgi:predicted transposase YbfD/YdcC
MGAGGEIADGMAQGNGMLAHDRPPITAGRPQISLELPQPDTRLLCCFRRSENEGSPEEQGMSIENLAQYFSTIEDPRCSGKVEHRLIDILVIAVCAVIACAESWDDIALYGRSKLAWLRTFLELANGIPSHDTFRRVFMLIDPEAFETGFATWVSALTTRFEREVVAIDGKTIRRSFDRGRDQSPLHVVSAWASEQGLVLGQRCVDGKSNEITAVPELLDQLALKNSIVTLDAMGCQTPPQTLRVSARSPRRSWRAAGITC